jgi:hypothetical protein
MTQHGSLPRREHRRHPPPSATNASNADDIDATKDLVELTVLQAPHDGSSAHPKRYELLPRHHAMLSLRKLRHRSVPLASR